MSSTRHSNDGSVFHQNRFASSAEIEKGLKANLVAKRLSVVKDAAHRELIWFLQYVSHQEGGLEAIARTLLNKYPNRLGTREMLAIGKSQNQSYNAEEVRKVRAELPHSLRGEFLLNGEMDRQLGRQAFWMRREAIQARFELACDEYESAGDRKELLRKIERSLGADAAEEVEKTLSIKRPKSFQVSLFLNVCRKSAEEGFVDGAKVFPLERELMELCLNPAHNLTTGPWYFAGLLNALLDYQKSWFESVGAGVVTTELGSKVWDALEYTQYSRSLSLVEGNARMGKTFSAKKWTELHTGQARFVEVPPGNDDASFYRALARGLGLGNFGNYKIVQIRERVESVLLNSDLMLVLDEAQRLWPQRNLRYGFPSRINWVMTMTNQGVPICCICTPQFIEAQKVAEKYGWNSAQLTGRIHHYQQLPASLSHADLMAVAKAVLPELDAGTLKAVAICAKSSARYLSAIEAIAKRAQFLANRAGRNESTPDDVRKAMQESFIPSDTKMKVALEAGKTGKTPRIKPTPVQPMPQMRDVLADDRVPSANRFENRNNNPATLMVGDDGE